jgi:hypothetical protein
MESGAPGIHTNAGWPVVFRTGDETIAMVLNPFTGQLPQSDEPHRSNANSNQKLYRHKQLRNSHGNTLTTPTAISVRSA